MRKPNLGFILPGLGISTYAMLGMGVLIAALFIGLKVQTSRLHASEARYDLFVANTLAVGQAQEAKTKAAIAHADQITKESAKAYESRLADINSKYDRLRNTGAGSGSVPAVPQTSRPVDDAARDNRLLDVLRYAEEQAEQLRQLQEWVKSNE